MDEQQTVRWALRLGLTPEQIGRVVSGQRSLWSELPLDVKGLLVGLAVLAGWCVRRLAW